MPPKHRDISPFLQLIRDFLLGRKYLTSHRYADTMSARTVKGGGMPETTDRLSANQYFTRDARCKVKPPIDLVEAKKLEEAAIAAAAAKAAEAAANPPKDGGKPGGPPPAAGGKPGGPPPAAGGKPAAAPPPPAAGGKPAAPAPASGAAAPAKPAAPDASKKDCKSTQSTPKNKTPLPGRLHNWD